MSNMSYCRFRNTARDLQDCIDAFDNIFIAELKEDSPEEFDASKI